MPPKHNPTCFSGLETEMDTKELIIIARLDMVEVARLEWQFLLGM